MILHYVLSRDAREILFDGKLTDCRAFVKCTFVQYPNHSPLIIVKHISFHHTTRFEK